MYRCSSVLIIKLHQGWFKFVWICKHDFKFCFNINHVCIIWLIIYCHWLKKPKLWHLTLCFWVMFAFVCCQCFIRFWLMTQNINILLWTCVNAFSVSMHLIVRNSVSVCLASLFAWIVVLEKFQEYNVSSKDYKQVLCIFAEMIHCVRELFVKTCSWQHNLFCAFLGATQTHTTDAQNIIHTYVIYM